MSKAAPTKPAPSVGAGLALDYGPLVIFFLANFLAPVPAALRIFVATGVFMAAMLIAMLISQVRYGRISPLLWFSGLMVIGFGGVTIWLHDPQFIKIKPTIYYLLIAALLLFGLLTRRNLLKLVIGAAYPGLSERGWYLLTRNWVLFFVGMAIVNELIWRTTSTDFWLGSKLWLFIPATLIFIVAHMPMLIRHGLTLDKPAEVPQVPVE
ncbi:MAG TPA: inner membrane-spanning protein YciB [Allosphingosinicella sp.]|nr:inner membrane-spanning protein YciB [Allosphingosinicella sp.]